MMQNFGLSRSVAKTIYDNYMTGFSGLCKYQERQREYVLKHGYILLNPITKHKAFIYDWKHLNEINDFLNTREGEYLYQHNDPTTKSEAKHLRTRISESQKQAINYPIQHSGAMCFKLSAIKFFRYLRAHNLLFIVKYCVPVHDEHNVEAPEDIIDDIAKVLKLCMEQAAEPFCTRAKLTADIEINNYWIH